MIIITVYILDPLFAGPKDVKDLLTALKDAAFELTGCNDDILKQQVVNPLKFFKT